MKIHFASFYGVDYDMDLLPWWAKWYREHDLDSYTVFLHRWPEKITDETADTFRDLGFEVRFVANAPYRDGLLQRNTMTEFAAKLPGDDFLVIADADEFQCMPACNYPVNYREVLRDNDMLCGFLCDFYGVGMEKCVKDPFSQYVHEQENYKVYLADFAPPEYRYVKWPLIRRTKVCAAKAGSGVSFIGSHAVSCVPMNCRIKNDFKVAHFAWREGARRKMIDKSQYSDDICAKVGGDDDEKVRTRRQDRMLVY
jgi:hypothetical protein